MMYKLLIIPFLLVATYYYVVPKKAFSYEEMQKLEKILITPLSVKQLIKVKGAEYNVSTRLMEEIINCESNGSTTIQSRHKYPTNRYAPAGSTELSFGVAQWHIPAGNKKRDGTVITKEDALNPEIAIDTMAWYIKNGKARIWSCYPIALKKMK